MSFLRANIILVCILLAIFYTITLSIVVGLYLPIIPAIIIGTLGSGIEGAGFILAGFDLDDYLNWRKRIPFPPCQRED